MWDIYINYTLMKSLKEGFRNATNLKSFIKHSQCVPSVTSFIKTQVSIVHSYTKTQECDYIYLIQFY